MKQCISLQVDPQLIRPLKKAQNEFIQVLLSSFTIRQGDNGLILEVEFDDESLAVWLREGKNYIRQQLDPKSVKKYQKEIENILLGQEKKDWVYNDYFFPFRFGNGGTLPVIRYGNKDYYSLFYRDIEPVGWNIANGGADSASELLDPLSTIERELREELIIVDPVNKFRYIFDWSEGHRPDHPDFAIARRVWDEIFQRHDFQQLRNQTLPLKWLSGHDSIFITYRNEDKIKVSDCFININAEDFGIEIDRVAKMTVSSNAIICDGELSNGKLLNQVVGLFDVHRFNAAIVTGKKEFNPDFIFWNGKNRSEDSLEVVVREYLANVIKQGIRTLESCRDWKILKYKYGLCPVTRNLIRRYLLMEPEKTPVQPLPFEDKNLPLKTDVFLSFASEDLVLAKKVYSYLENSGHKVFFSNETLHHSNFGDEIDNALRSARSLVLIGTETDRFYKPYVRFEWQSFHNDILAGRKPWKAPFITFTTNPDMNSLPLPLVNRQIIDYSKKSWDESLRELNHLLTALP
jgi:hypothetical protein